MSYTDHQWLSSGSGRAPDLKWSFTTDAPLLWMELARESGEVLLADAAGGLYLLDRAGKIASVTHVQPPIRGVAWSDTGQGGVVLIGESRLHWLSPRLEFTGQVDLPDMALSVAIDSHGEYVAASLASGENLIFDGPRKPMKRFETQRPFVKMVFLVEAANLVGVADYGLLGCRTFTGEVVWDEKLWANVGGLAVTNKAEMILAACFAHGVQRYDLDGESVGSYQLEGTPHRVACTYLPQKLIVGTLEGHLHWLKVDGQMQWSAEAPDDIVALQCDPLGHAVYAGFQTGRVMRLEWT